VVVVQVTVLAVVVQEVLGHLPRRLLQAILMQ
jgi:hypothetical protein